MKRLLLLSLFVSAGCASTGSSEGPPRQATERRSTTVSYSTPDGRAVNINLQTASNLETKSYAMPAAPRGVWSVLPLAYQDLGIALAAYDSTEMYIGNPGLEVRGGRLGNQRMSHYVNCGMDPMGGPVADRYNVRLNVVSRVRPTPDGSVLETQVMGDAVQRGVSAQAVACSSTGELEEALANATKLRLAGAHPTR